MTFSLFHHVCFPMKIPLSFQSFPNQFWKTMLHTAPQEAFFGTPSLREASRKHQHNSAIKCITGKNVPHKVIAKRLSKRNAKREPSRIIYHNKRSNYFFFGKTCILEPKALATDVFPFGGGFAGSPLGWD